jgi:predicted DNA-binding transcriptional regulator AlpA
LDVFFNPEITGWRKQSLSSKLPDKHFNAPQSRFVSAFPRGERVFVSDKTLAAMLDTSRSSIWRYVKGGIIPPPIKIGSLTRFDLEEAVAAIREQAQGRRKP